MGAYEQALIYILLCLYDIEHNFVFRKPTLTHGIITEIQHAALAFDRQRLAFFGDTLHRVSQKIPPNHLSRLLFEFECPITKQNPRVYTKLT